MKHLVNRLILEITCGSEDDAFHLQHNLAPLLQQQVAEAIEKASQDRTDSTELVIIDRIEINLGTFSFHVQEQVLANLIQHEVEEQLKPYLQAKPEDDKNKLSQENSTALFHYFMLTGNLPWWAQTTEPAISEVFMELIDNRYDDTIGFLYANRASSIFWKRIVYQFNSKAKKKLADSVPNIKQGFGLLLATVQQQESTRDSSFLEEQRFIGEKEMLDMLLLDAPSLYSDESSNNLIGALTKIIKKNTQLPGMETVLQEVTKWKPEPVKSSDEKHDPSTIHIENDYKEPERYFISHSGIIILAPYLKMFFNRLLLLEDEQWKNSPACVKAVHLLRYLACGETGIAEYQLTLEKIICGLSPVAPVPVDARLEPHELDEADSLLQSVVENWKKLGNTSIFGLRESFLKRDGIVIRKENNWLLQVERKTLDVLLDSIPWGFSTTSLPWNNYIIFTEW